MGDTQQEADPGPGGAEEGAWHPPNQNAAIMAEAAPAIVSRSQNGDSPAFVNGGHLGQAYVGVAGQFGGAAYQELRPSFSGAYQLSAASQQDLFQAAHSTYDGLAPPGPTGFVRPDHGDSEAMPAFSSMAADNGTHIITASTVDSSSLQQGYLVLDQDNQLVAVQRVVSPTDCTVSQSTLSVGQDRGDGQPSTTLLTMPAMSSGGQYVMQMSLPTFASQEEVSTSSTERQQTVTLGVASFPQAGGMLGGVRKVEMESTTGECDTTQEDLDSQPLHSAAGTRYLHAVGLPAHSVGMESGGLHTTMVAMPRSVAATITSADLHSGPLSSLQNVPMATGGIVVPRVESSGGGAQLSRVVDSRAIADALEEAMVSGSGLAETSGMETHPQQYQVAAAVSDENLPSTSGTVAQTTQQRNHQTRKSSRLAGYQQLEELDSRNARQQYEPRQYNIMEMWCEECQSAYQQQCPIHRFSVITDKVVLSRAWASLPSMLQIYRLGANDDEHAIVDMGVFAKKAIPKLTQFGPFVAELVDNANDVTNKHFMLTLEKSDGAKGFFETCDENKCNWMMFVRPAATYGEQNLVAYQYGQDLYYSVIKNIEPRQELKVWYAAHYAEQHGLKTHELTDADWALMDEAASRFQCSACSRRFRTSLALQRHLLEHERDEMGHEEEEEEGGKEEEGVEVEEGGEEEEGRGGRKGKRRAGGKNVLLKGKGKQNGDAGSSYQWKKKSTSIYINKSLKKYQKRGPSAGVRQTMKSLYRRRGRGIGGLQEWVCTHCNLTFDNPSVLNLHTLTHAAEDVGLDELHRLAGGGDNSQAKQDAANDGGNSVDFGGEDIAQMVRLVEGEGDTMTLETCLVCPMCHVQFDHKRALIEHAAEHAKAPRPDRPFKCHMCWKAFSLKEKLQKHLLCHGEEASKPLPCEYCSKRFMNNSALACHLKTHSASKYYTCPLCGQGFDHICSLKDHVPEHADANGRFTCTYCDKAFTDYHCIRKHMKSFHSDKQYKCDQCNRIFPRPDKLKLHMLRHTSHREFMCETCGRQFKRKDKLKEHVKRMHCMEKEARTADRPPRDSCKKFIPKVSPNEYQRFIYKCHTCMLGFKRRGMLVNHLNKRHPNVKPETVHELSLPILKQQRDYYCQHCEKVYKSSSKRKAHIIKNHPGADLPASSRKRALVEEVAVVAVAPGGGGGGAAGAGLVNCTFSQAIGSITTMPHSCEFCHKQYASKAKLMQHQRKLHSDLVPAAMRRKPPQHSESTTSATSATTIKNDLNIIDIVNEDGSAVPMERYEDIINAAAAAAAVTPGGSGGELQQADLLTQAMTELISTHADFRPGSSITVHGAETIQLGRFVTGAGPTLLQVQPNGTLQPATIELSQLTQALNMQTQFAAGTTLIAAPAGPHAHHHAQQQVLSAQPLNISMVTTNGNGTTTIPVSIQGNQAFVPRTWASTIQTFQR